MSQYLGLILLLLCPMGLSGCANLIASQTTQLTEQLSTTIVNNDDPDTVAAALPTLLILIESFTKEDPSSELLQTAAKLHSAYASGFVKDSARKQGLNRKALGYAKRAACQYQSNYCGITALNFKELTRLSESISIKDVPIIYTLATSCLGYVQAYSDDSQVIADLPKVKALLETLVALDESYDYGGSHLYLGAIATLLPPSLGGKPEIGKAHFERTINMSSGRHLMAKVEYARRYARLMFDQALHHQLLTEVLETDIEVEGLTLINAIAKQQAEQLLAEEADYF